ncbi:twin-arginine translocase subunit TatB [Pseudomonas sp. CCM 7891]|uniref:Twin-arginine translocase subunit TatB n=1 Tax=Pseudomonas karstica TaxID=1055468 RepID=A0A7X2RN70_9PSED|nr:Sec-independent protein translocase protein TatB [Pseudomonas karstica]MTD17913.1 twin-arginine translocase subunit TatB [Pseudomonas karstica]
MFDIGFSELLLVGLVALLVLGPERLPIAARNAGLWLGRAKRAMNMLKAQVTQELDNAHLLQGIDHPPLRQLEQQLREGIRLDPTPAAAPPPESGLPSGQLSP